MAVVTLHFAACNEYAEKIPNVSSMDASMDSVSIYLDKNF